MKQPLMHKAWVEVSRDKCASFPTLENDDDEYELKGSLYTYPDKTQEYAPIFWPLNPYSAHIWMLDAPFCSKIGLCE